MAFDSSDDEFLIPDLAKEKKSPVKRTQSSDEECYLIPKDDGKTESADASSVYLLKQSSDVSGPQVSLVIVEKPSLVQNTQVLSLDEVISEIFNFIIPGRSSKLITAGKKGAFMFNSTVLYELRQDDPHYLSSLVKRFEPLRKMFLCLWDFGQRTDLIKTVEAFQAALLDLLTVTIEELDEMKQKVKFNGFSSVVVTLQKYHHRLLFPYKLCSQFQNAYYFDDYSLDILHENVLKEAKTAFTLTDDEVLKSFIFRVSDDFLRIVLSYIDWLFETQRMSKISDRESKDSVHHSHTTWNYKTFSTLVSFPILWSSDLRQSLVKASRAMDALRKRRILDRRESLTPFSNFFRHRLNEAGLCDQILEGDEIKQVLEKSAADCAYQYDNRLLQVILRHDDLKMILEEYREIVTFSAVPEYFLATLKLSRNKVVLDKKLREILQLHGFPPERAKRWHVDVPDNGDLAQIRPQLNSPVDGILPDCFWHTTNMSLSLLFTVYYAHLQLIEVLQHKTYNDQSYDASIRRNKLRLAAFLNMRLCSALFDCLSNYISTVTKAYTEEMIASETVSEVMALVKQLDAHMRVIFLTDTDSRKLFHATVKAMCSTAKKLHHYASSDNGLPDENTLESVLKVLARCRETFIGFSKLDHPVYESLAARISGKRSL
ncbi:hypothetical protein QR680_000634 [Steinernema hermaphroditum]|uniref:Uncharacterized protein n=1 Tax=Steinernema hermaphroditum TaxID=289476 RepID=A0AA39GW46_9BILA|nr:hypothetical protein QR680_000634 [Steinernema hermaphroditum]